MQQRENKQKAARQEKRERGVGVLLLWLVVTLGGRAWEGGGGCDGGSDDAAYFKQRWGGLRLCKLEAEIRDGRPLILV